MEEDLLKKMSHEKQKKYLSAGFVQKNTNSVANVALCLDKFRHRISVFRVCLDVLR